MDLGERCHFNWRIERRQTVEKGGCYKSTEDDITWSVNRVCFKRQLDTRLKLETGARSWRIVSVR